MNHLTPDELVDAVEDALASGRVAHVASCVMCRDKVSQFASILSETRAVEIAEPSPLFWDRFSDRVREAVAAEPAPSGWLPHWLQWPVLVPLTGIALLLLTLASAVPTAPGDVKTETRVARGSPSPLTGSEADADAGWAAISDLLGPMDFETAQEAGLVAAPGAADQAALLLSAAEQQELVRLLQQELKVGG